MTYRLLFSLLVSCRMTELLPEVVDGGVAEGEEDGVEGQALDGVLSLLAQRVRTHAEIVVTIFV